ncbi:hypothetical protein GCM10009533_00280 [Saccharopolyspora spinosporotrichia]|uniref:Uncharacterized protein n=1 Tax=Saccharopolyspora erythraea TaxID=1836 RepID=A0ABP3LSY1_SACER
MLTPARRATSFIVARRTFPGSDNVVMVGGIPHHPSRAVNADDWSSRLPEHVCADERRNRVDFALDVRVAQRLLRGAGGNRRSDKF